MIKFYKAQFEQLDKEEKANVWTHGLMLVIAATCGPLLITKAQDVSTVVGMTIFYIGIVFMLISSTVYHIIYDPKRKAAWQLVDHISIFVLISSSYTAFFVYYYDTHPGYQFLALHWFISFCGIIFKILTRDKYEWISLALYVILGWMVVFVFPQVTQNMTSEVFSLLMIGGVSYMIGVVFYVWERLRFNHAIWHIGVNVGLIAHSLALWQS
jgi:hemolysin III